MVADVDERLPVGQRLLADLGQADHHLQPGPDALLEGGEAELARVADEDDAARHTDDVVGLLAGLQVAPLLADLLEGMRTAHLDGVRVASAVEQPLPLLAAYPDLLRDVVDRRFEGLAGHRSSMAEPPCPPSNRPHYPVSAGRRPAKPGSAPGWKREGVGQSARSSARSRIGEEWVRPPTLR